MKNSKVTIEALYLKINQELIKVMFNENYDMLKTSIAIYGGKDDRFNEFYDLVLKPRENIIENTLPNLEIFFPKIPVINQEANSNAIREFIKLVFPEELSDSILANYENIVLNQTK